jgi:hypothetical protein
MRLFIARSIFLTRAVLRDRIQLLIRIRRRLFGENRLDEALRHGIGKPAIRRGGMGVIVSRQREVSLGLGARPRDDILARPHELDHRQRDVRVVGCVGGLSLLQKGIERAGIRFGGQRFAIAGGQFDDPRPALRRLYDTLDRAHTGVPERLRHGLIGGDHEIFN